MPVFAGVTCLLLFLVLLAWFALRASLPQLDGEIAAPGLSELASIHRDVAGVPTIRATSRLDLAYAMGFAHGQDRYFQMDLIRRQAAGELAEILGAVALPIDKRFRFHRFRSRAKAVMDAASPADRSLLERYAAGVNAGRESLSSRPFEYYVLGTKPEPWVPQDSILVVYAMFMQLSDPRASKEIRRGLARSVLPDQVYAWMYPAGTPWDAPLIGNAHGVAAIPPASILSLRDVADDAPPANEQGRYPLRGSNSWAVSGALTDDGRAIVANDMHLGLSIPNIYYRARMVVDAETSLDITGVTLPGSPFVIAGSNTHVAWGFTNSYGDFSDAVVLRPGEAAGTYVTPEGDRSFDVYNERINVKGSDPVEYRIRETIWGPVLDDVNYPDGEVVVSWTAHRTDAVNLNIRRLETVHRVSEAIDIASSMGMPPQNFVAGDASGNIGWTIAGRIPQKSTFNAMSPADWSEQHGWLGWVAQGDYPRIINPESGRIWTANARVLDTDALKLLGDGGYDLGARARQIRDGLLAKDRFVPTDMLAIQTDDRALFLTPWRELLLRTLDSDAVTLTPELIEYRRLVQTWIPRAVPESVGYRLVRAFRLEVEQRVFHALMAPVRAAYGDDIALRRSNQFEAPLWSLLTLRPEHMLPAGYENWDRFLLAAVQQNIEYFNDKFDGPLSARTWGELNIAAIRHPLSRSVPVFGGYLDMPANQLNGDLDMPRAQGPAFGASERFSVAPGNEAGSLFHMPTGPSGHPLSPYYDAGHSDWVGGLPSPFLPGDEKHILTLSPDKR